MANTMSPISTNSPILLAENKALNIVCNFTNHDQHVLVIWKYKEDVEYNSFSDEDKQRISIDPKDGSLFISKANKKYYSLRNHVKY
ncbi:unnamed protein product [Oppiella nova]|uniref:Uncharacterized protein n=1 Tax=Oppiella nova TaxID=334625 RepID=A0A7R9LJG8_9ACAR|nr:unnamed protein product [Oppiella nova]CAG2163594.1 unnamed protein product [Oppiella nova]